MFDERENRRVADCYDYRNASANIWSDFIEKHMKGENVIELQGEDYQIRNISKMHRYNPWQGTGWAICIFC